MSVLTNQFGQPIGEDVLEWTAREWPSREPMKGRFCTLEPLDAERHSQDLFDAFSADDGRMWTYMPVGPFAVFDDVQTWLENIAPSKDPTYYAIVDTNTDRAVGMASYLRITPAMGVIEVGHIAFSPQLQKTPIATEAMFLMMQRVFNELGYRRYEWKCDSLNAPSRRAAERFGFTYDGIFKQAVVYKGRNRDTAWYSMLDKDWPQIESAYKLWLAPDNFDDNGRQRKRLADLINQQRVA